MARITFENDDWSKKIVVISRELPEETKFDVEFFPTHTTDDFEEDHYILFRLLFEALNQMSGGVEITKIEK